MLKELADLPAGVIGFEVAGKLTAEDYRDHLLPALERAESSGEIRVVIVMPEFEGFTAGAALAGPQDGRRELGRLEAHRPRHRRGVDAARHRLVRLDDTR